MTTARYWLVVCDLNETIKFDNVLYKNGWFNNKLSAVENLTLNTGNMAKINNLMLIYHVFRLVNYQIWEKFLLILGLNVSPLFLLSGVSAFRNLSERELFQLAWAQLPCHSRLK